MPQKPKKYKKRPPKKIYDIRQLKEKWKLQRHNEKKFQAKMATVLGLVWIVLLIGFAVLCFILSNYQPIEYDKAISYSVAFEKYRLYHRTRGGTRRYIEFANGDSKSLSNIFFYSEQTIKADLEALPKGTTLDLKLHPDGDVLEIKAGDKEILNFDYAQKQLQKRSIFFLVMGILSCAGIIPCAIYVWKKIVGEKVFSRAVQFYK